MDNYDFFYYICSLNSNNSVMNLRDIKKDIEYLVGAFVDDCTLFLSINPNKQTEEVSALIDEAITLYNDLKDKVSKPEGAKRAFYDGLRKELLEKLDALYEKLSEVVKAGVKGE